jgi:hypothetical protein
VVCGADNKFDPSPRRIPLGGREENASERMTIKRLAIALGFGLLVILTVGFDRIPARRPSDFE